MASIETERLILRRYRETDLPEYHRLMSDRKNMYFLSDIATDTLEESRESLTQAIELNRQEKARRFCVTLKNIEKLIGGVGYDIVDETPVGKIVHMGWFIMPEYQNKGYMTEAAKRILEYAFNEDGCIRVATGCYKDNIPTQRIMANAGLRQEAEKIEAQWHDGKMKTRLEFAVNRNEWLINERGNGNENHELK